MLTPIYIDSTRLLLRALQSKHPTGVDRVGLAYVQKFSSRACALVKFAGRWVFFSKADSRCIFNWLISPDKESIAQILWLLGKNYVLNWKGPRGKSILFNIVHSGLDSADYGFRCRQYRMLPIYFLHDLIPIRFPEYGRKGEDEKHRRRILTMLSSAQGLMLNSAATGRELEAYAASLGVVIPPHVVAHLAPPEFPLPLGVRPMPAPYFIVLGTIEPRKNHLLLLTLWRQLVEELGRDAPRLVVIGRRGWECEQVIDMLERCAMLKGIVVELPSCDDAALVTWMHHSQALLFPSFAEGYGIPLVEALSLGTPVIASDLPVFRELGGDIPEYLNPLDGLGWKRAILAYSSPDEQARLEQRVRMAGWLAPNWADHFLQVKGLMMRLGVE